MRTRPMRTRPAAAVVAMVLMAAACTSSGSGDDAADGRPRVDTGAATTEAAFTVTPGVQQVTVTGARPGQPLTLADATGAKLLTLEADDQGQAVFAYAPDEYASDRAGALLAASGNDLVPGGGYTLRDETTDPVEVSGPFAVLGIDDHPDPELYERQEVGEGFGYVEVRDGVELSVMVRFPNPDLYGPGPYPTVIEYSGYSPSRPGGPEPGSNIAALLGYATVGVNMRGSGCSGGTFDVFNPAQQADGYDVVETIARQPWVLHNHVGMIGLSYSGITQLYVAATRPPSLAAITPLSVIEDPWRMQWPSGVYNSGFTRQWLSERDRQSAVDGSSWVSEQIDSGDETCAANMALRSQNLDFEAFAKALENRPDSADARRLSLLVPNIEVPVYLTGAWQDEQTGPAFATMLDRFTGTDQKQFTLFNGRHPDGYSPMVLTRWYEWLEFYVAERVPRLSPLIRAGAPVAFEDEFEVPGLGFEPDRFTEFADDDYAGALAALQAQPDVRVLFESGAAGPVPGAPQFVFEATFDAWPPPEVEARTWFLGPDETLVDQAPSTAGVDQYTFDPDAGSTPYTDTGAYDFIKPLVPADWTQGPPGSSLSYLTQPFAENVVMAGPGYADLWFRTDEPDANIEVVVSIVQPDGTEYFVQHGLMRASNRTVADTRANGLQIDYSYRKADRQDLPAGEWVELKVPIFPFAQVFRAGSRLRLQVNTPGRDTPLWQFESPGSASSTFQVGYGGEQASGLVLPTVPAFPVAIPEAFPACPMLRGQVCRTFVATENTPG